MKPIIVIVALYFIVMHYVLRDCIKEDGKEKGDGHVLQC